MSERFDIDVGYRDPDDLPRDDFPEDKPSPNEYEDDLVERVAEAIYEASEPITRSWEQLDERAKNDYRDLARAAIAETEKDR